MLLPFSTYIHHLIHPIDIFSLYLPPKLPIPLRTFPFPSNHRLEWYLYFLLGIIALSNNQTDIQWAYRYAIWFDQESLWRKESSRLGEKTLFSGGIFGRGKQKSSGNDKIKEEARRTGKMSSRDDKKWSVRTDTSRRYTWFTHPTLKTTTKTRGKMEMTNERVIESEVRNVSGKVKICEQEFAINALREEK